MRTKVGRVGIALLIGGGTLLSVGSISARAVSASESARAASLCGPGASTATVTVTETPDPVTNTATVTDTQTQTNTLTNTETVTESPATVTETITNTVTDTQTNTVTDTQTNTVTETVTDTSTSTYTTTSTTTITTTVYALRNGRRVAIKAPVSDQCTTVTVTETADGTGVKGAGEQQYPSTLKGAVAGNGVSKGATPAELPATGAASGYLLMAGLVLTLGGVVTLRYRNANGPVAE